MTPTEPEALRTSGAFPDEEASTSTIQACLAALSEPAIDSVPFYAQPSVAETIPEHT